MKNILPRVFLLSCLFACPISLMAESETRQWRNVADVYQRYHVKVETRLQPRFAFIDATWPPQEVTLLSIKDEKRMELWSKEPKGWVFIKDYKIKGASGYLGPKLREGDRQVPEGIYDISLLNPNSKFHLSLKINYPNSFDRKYARIEKRSRPGGQIFIHGNALSRGCLAMGNNAIEELFVLTSLIGKENVNVIIAPIDFRKYAIGEKNRWQVAWKHELKVNIANAMNVYRDTQH